MITVNEARWHWLNNRNSDLMSECYWRMKRLIEMVDESTKDHIWTEYFEPNFNSKHEEFMLVKYMEGMGYSIEIEHTEESGVFEAMTKIRIGI